MSVVDSNLIINLGGAFQDTLKLQLDGGGDPEIMFTLMGYSTPQLGSISEIGLMVGSSAVGLHIMNSADTSWIGDEVDTIIGGQWTVEVRTSHKNDCAAFPGAGTFSTDAQDMDLVVLDSGEDLSVNDTFGPFSDLAYRSPGSTTSMPSVTGFSGDTVFTSLYYSTFDCDYLPLDVPMYVGFKWNDGGTERLGWIHFLLEHPREVRVQEVAVQRD